MFLRLLSLSEIKDEDFVKENILWDVLPKDLISPTVCLKDGCIERKPHLKGYVFYIDTSDKRPVLSLIRHTAAGYAETLAQIDEIPEELLLEAIEEGKDKCCFMMYPINQKVRQWLREALGIT